MASFAERMIGAARLDPQTYEEVEHDTNAMGQAMAVVVISAVAAGIGAVGQGGAGVIGVTIGALIGWFIWAGLTFIIGTKVLPEPQTKADMGQLLRTIGFAASPGILRILGVVPVLGPLIVFGANVWMLVAMVIGVRQALDYQSTGRAIGVCVIGFVIYLLFGVAIAMALGVFRAATSSI